MAITPQKTLDLDKLLSKARCIHKAQSSKNNILIYEYKQYRFLTFGDNVIQSLIDIENNKNLPFVHNQAILSSLLFVDAKKICLVGTGGGGLARFIHSIDSDIQGICIEHDKKIIQLAKQYFDFPNENWVLHHGDALQYKFTSTQDLIIIDIANGHKMPNWITEQLFLKKIFDGLTESGIAVFNIVYESDALIIETLLKIRKEFSALTLCFQVKGLSNILVFAFKNPLIKNKTKMNSKTLLKKVRVLHKKWGINFTDYLKEIIKSNPPGSGVL